MRTLRLLATILGLGLILASRVVAEDPDDQTLRGLVVDQEGRPAADAEVWLVANSHREPFADAAATTRADSAGRFVLIVPGRWFQLPFGLRGDLGILARGRRSGLGSVIFDRATRIPEEVVRISLPAHSQTVVRILDPDQKPVANARVTADLVGAPQILTEFTEAQARLYTRFPRTPLGLVIRYGMVPAPAALQKSFSATTDGTGLAIIAGIAREQIYGIGINTPGFGEQRIMLRELEPGNADAGRPLEFELSRTATLRGRLTSDNPEWIKGRRLVLQTGPAVTKPDDRIVTTGFAEVTTDAAGRFEITSLAAGRVYFTRIIDADSRSCLQPREELSLVPGRTHDSEIPVVPTVRVRGRVEEADTGQQLADVEVAVFTGAAHRVFVRTDEKGSYEVDLAPPGAFITALLPRGWVPTNTTNGAGIVLEIPPDRAEREAPPTKLRRPATIRGTVRDDRGEPVPMATISAAWFGYDRRTGRPEMQEFAVVADERGEFTLEADLQSPVRLRAHTPGACTRDVTTLERAPDEPVPLRVSPRSTARLRGRVTDASGVPVGNVPVDLWSRGRIPLPPASVKNGEADDSPGVLRRIDFGEGAPLLTDEQGHFETPPLPAGIEYRVELRGAREAIGEWVVPSAGKSIELAALAIGRAGKARGVVHDRQGKPVAGAEVVWCESAQRAESQTDDAGTFHMSNVARGNAFLFVRKAGFRFYGMRIDPGPVDVILDVILEAIDEPPLAAYKPTPARRDPAADRALALKLVRESLEAAKDERDRMRAIQALARIDPAAGLAELGRQPPKQAQFGDMIRRVAARTLMRGDLEAALEVVAAMSPGIGQAITLCEICDSLPESAGQRKLELLADALVQVRGIKEPEMRIGGAGFVAERLLDLGERERGKNILRDELETARRMGTAEFAGYARGAFAEELGQIDLPEALALIKDLKDPRAFNRHHGNLAHELAGRQPAEAERVLDLIKPPQQNEFSERDHYGVRVCYRMATVDQERAERIATSIKDLCGRGHALGVMAAALADQDPALARALLARAYDVLDDADRHQKPLVGPHPPAIVAGWLLSLADRLDPDREHRPLLKECVWKTVALVPPRTSDPNRAWYVAQSAAPAALWLADYDAPLALDMLSRIDASQLGYGGDPAPALALLAPERLEKHLAGLPDENTRNAARLSAAAILSVSGDDLRRQIHHDTGLWPIDMEDLGW